jgi:hypothetical protein
MPAGLVLDRAADIIPIDSRRRLQVPRRPAFVARGEVRHPWGVAALFSVGLLFVAGVATFGAVKSGLGNSVKDLPDADRVALYRRSLEDVESSCTLAAAREGALRDHCVRQAQFLTLFPECDAACQRTVTAILPRVHR